MATAATQVRDRTQIDAAHKWDLSDIYADWASWQAGLAELETGVDGYSALKGTLATGPSALLAAYRAGDEEALRALLFEWKSSPESVEAGGVGAAHDQVSSPMRLTVAL
mgnify:CR=1 FL=1